MSNVLLEGSIVYVCPFCTSKLASSLEGYSAHLQRYHQDVLTPETKRLLPPQEPSIRYHYQSTNPRAVSRVEARLREEGRLFE